jgi:plasmid maintenance system antidote protein VapI
MKKTPKKLGQPIDQALILAIKSSGQTHYKLGHATGVAPSQIDRLVSGERSISLETAAKLASELGLELRPRRG